MGRNHKRRQGLELAVASLCLAGAYSAAGLAQQRPDAGTILQQVTPPPGQPASGNVPAFTAPPTRLPQGTAIKVTVRQFRISGNTLFSDAQLQAVVAEYLNKELDYFGLEATLDAIKTFYRSRGYFLTVAYLPTQEIKDGVVQIYVLEGRIGKATANVAPGTWIRPGVVDWYLSPITPGGIATEGEIYRQLLLLQDLPGVDVRSTIGPGAKPGEADLAVDVGNRGNRIAATVDFDDFGSKFAGMYRAGVQVFVNSPAGLGDLLTLRGLESNNNGTQVTGLSYVVPVGPWGTKVGGSFTQLRYHLWGTTVDPYSASQDVGALKASGEGTIANLILVHPLLRTRDYNLFLQLTAQDTRTKDNVLPSTVSTAFNTQNREIRAYKLGFNGDYRDRLWGGSLNSAGLTVTSGQAYDRPDGALADAANADAAGTGGDRAGAFTKFSGDYQRTQRITNNWYGIVHISGQTANRNLPAVERFSIGGPLGVRAYPVGEGLADAGVLGTVEGRYNVPGVTFGKSTLALAGFVDGASIRRNISQQPSDTVSAGAAGPLPVGTLIPNNRRLWGAGVGVRVAGDPRYQLSVDLAWRLSSDKAQADTGRSPALWVHGAINF